MGQIELKYKNQYDILGLIRLRESISQAEIAKELDLQPSTVSNLVRELKEWGVIGVTGKGESGKTGGKRSDLLSINGEAAFFSGIYVRQNRVISHLINYQGISVQMDTLYFNPESPGEVVSIIAAELRRHNKESPRYRGAGIAVSAVVNPHGDVEISPDFFWGMKDFRDQIKKAVGDTFPIIVENDANCAALYCYHFFQQQYSNILLFLFSDKPQSMGAGIILDGKLYTGSNGSAGELLYQEKDDIVQTLARHIHQIGSFFDPDILFVAGEQSPSVSVVNEICSVLKSLDFKMPVRQMGNSDLAVIGAAYIVSNMVTELLIKGEL